MNMPFFFRVVILSLVLTFPRMAIAKGHLYNRSVIEFSGIDSLRGRKPTQKPEDQKPETTRPDIKEVPRSRRLPKPTAVTDRIKNRRPPVKVVRPRVIKRHLGI